MKLAIKVAWILFDKKKLPTIGIPIAAEKEYFFFAKPH